ncbi:Sec23 [Anopheles sinensis]|uniref:Sec23 n=1 Tax=Anopheles sinensis TaxID=74873 RepID=A0A084WJT4_ANOSI|nr:Sec23 [Anopheles sinensis]
MHHSALGHRSSVETLIDFCQVLPFSHSRPDSSGPERGWHWRLHPSTILDQFPVAADLDRLWVPVGCLAAAAALRQPLQHLKHEPSRVRRRPSVPGPAGPGEIR